ncbi:DUF3618 domain-containing protein [Cribrihabitans neustonicus]|uniref:DUF3618 domain-containing protein n=1 Tax=Cribrihabitans neustonicus TaxID=1429085 RepID=UPI003B5A2B69
MTSDNRSPQEIEREIERDRAQLSSNLEHLQDRFSVDGVVRQVTDQLREHGGELGQAITRTVKENPAAVALTGIGLAWMIFGGGPKTRGADDYRSYRGRMSSGRQGGSYLEDDELQTRQTYRGSRPIPRPDPRFKGGSVGVPAWALEDEDDESLSDRAAANAAAARDSVTGAVGAARDKTAAAGSAVADKASDASSAIKGKAAEAGAAAKGHASAAAESVSAAAQSARERAARMRARLSEGTENLSEAARERVIAAREAAVDARRRAASAMSAHSERASDFFERQPLVAGALALAVGAAIGGALPRSRKEDELMGAHSDELIARAEAILREEKEKALAVAEAAKDEARDIAKEKREELDSGAPGDKSAGEAVADEAKKAGKRVADAASKKADEKNLGKLSS